MTGMRATQARMETEGGVPTALIHAGTRYRVSDTPTRLEEDMGSMTHPLPVSGWRFQGTDRAGESHMFDVILRGEEWRVGRVYD